MSQIKYLDLTGLETYHNRLRSGVLTFKDTENRSVTYKPGDSMDLTKGIYYATTSKTATRVSNPLTIKTLDEDIVWNGSQKETIDLSTNWVIVKGDADNSAVLKGEYQGYSNKAISQVSTSIGAATTAGLKGWYYSKITFGNNPVITLSDKQPTVLLNNLVGGAWSSGTPNIVADDKVSIVNNSKYDYCGEVKSVSGNKITLKTSLPFDSLDTGVISLNNPDDWSIYLPDKEGAGVIDFGGGALAEGVNTKATNIGAHAEGIQTHAYGQYSHTEGFKTQAGYAAHAEGRETIASGSRSHSEGDGTTASGDMSHAEGNSTKAIGKYSHAEGYSSSSEANASHAEGYSTIATGDSSHAEGWKSTAKGKRSHAEGSETYSGGHYSHTEGLGTKTTNEAEHASGKYNVSSSDTLFSVGNGTSDADRKNAFEIKTDNTAYVNGKQIATLNDIPAVDTELNPDSNNPIANSVVANAIKGGVHFKGVYDRLPDELVDVVDEDGFEIDIETKQIGIWHDEENDIEVVFYEGDIIIVSPNMTDGESEGEYIPEEPTKEYILTYAGDAIDIWKWVELGDVTPAQNMIDASVLFMKGTGTGSVIVKNRGCIADGQYSTVFGRNGRAYGNYSYVEGRGQGNPSSITKDNAENSWDSAEVSDNTSDNLHLGVGDYVHVEGLNNIAVGNCSHVEGQRNKSKGVSSHAEGWKTQSNGARSHAEGQSTKANGSESHAGGLGSIATGARSFVHGNYVKTTNDDEVAFGKYNRSESNTLFSVGGGTSEINRKNVFEITKDAGYIHDEKIATLNDIQTFNHIKEYNDKVNIDIPVYSTKFFENGTSLVNKYAQKSLVTQLSNTVANLQNTITKLQNTITVLERRIEALEQGGGTDYDGTCMDNYGTCADNAETCADHYGSCGDNEGPCADNYGGCADNHGGCADNYGTCADNYGCGDPDDPDDWGGACADGYGSCADNYGSCGDDGGTCADNGDACGDNGDTCGDNDGLCGSDSNAM